MSAQLTVAEFPEIVRGDTYHYRLSFSANGSAIDISGWVLRMLLKTDAESDDADALFDVQYTVPNDADAQAGIYVFTVTSEDTAVETGTHHLIFKRTISGSPDDVKTLKRQAIPVVNP